LKIGSKFITEILSCPVRAMLTAVRQVVR